MCGLKKYLVNIILRLGSHHLKRTGLNYNEGSSLQTVSCTCIWNMNSYHAVGHIPVWLHVDTYVLGPHTYVFIFDMYNLQMEDTYGCYKK